MKGECRQSRQCAPPSVRGMDTCGDGESGGALEVGGAESLDKIVIKY